MALSLFHSRFALNFSISLSLTHWLTRQGLLPWCLLQIVVNCNYNIIWEINRRDHLNIIIARRRVRWSVGSLAATKTGSLAHSLTQSLGFCGGERMEQENKEELTANVCSTDSIVAGNLREHLFADTATNRPTHNI